MGNNFSFNDGKLHSYLGRIKYSGALLPDYKVLEALHLAHVRHIPFENIDAFLGRPVRVDIDSIHQKLVVEKRGGYCFEQNILFAAVLLKLGFKIEMLAARVVFRMQGTRPRSHMLLLVHLDETWLADVGFGAYGLLSPVLLNSGEISDSICRSFLVDERNGLWRLCSLNNEAWEELYIFSPERQEWIDYQMANYYISTHPDSIFTQKLTVQTQTETSRIILTGNKFEEQKDSETIESILVEEDRLSDILVVKFNIKLPFDLLLSLQRALFY